MKLEFFGDPVERQIVEEIREWSKEALEKPSPFFKGLPPCPYAKKAWAEDRVAILFKPDQGLQVLYSTLSQYEDRFDLVIIVDRCPRSSDEFHDYLDRVNEAIAEGVFIDRDLWVMGFHPDDEESEFVETVDFVSQVDEAYGMIFVQRLSLLQEAADKLRAKGYYDTYLEEYDAESIYLKRETFYRKLKEPAHGNETP